MPRPVITIMFRFTPEQYDLLEKWTAKLGKPFTTAIREQVILLALEAEDKEGQETNGQPD